MNRSIPTPLHNFTHSPVIVLKGTYYLLENYYGNNYAHTSMQSVGGYLYAKKAGFFKNKKIQLATYRLDSTQKKLWNAVGIDERRALYLKKNVTYIIETCYFSNLYIDTDCLNAALVRTFEDVCRSVVTTEREEHEKKRFYVARKYGLTRKSSIQNEDKVFEYLTKKGFSIVDTARLSIPDQMRLFANAETIVAPHGASGANLLYTGGNASFVELFSETWVKDYNAKILAYKNSTYTGTVNRALAPYLEKDSDFLIDLELLDHALANPLHHFSGHRKEVAYPCREEAAESGPPERLRYIKTMLSFAKDSYRLIHLAMFAVETGKLERALFLTEKALSFSPENLHMIRFHIFLLKALRKEEAAHRVIDAVKTKFPLWTYSQ
ncbi:MAG: glycosyltransferase family 61 protein [Desulfovibrio sp.]|nr:glycosyltransferase family 61 protein [Desulfovibrio sp.]